MQIYTAVTLLCVTLAASVYDARSRIIPNRLCNLGMLLALLSRLLENRWFSSADLYGSILILILLMLFYRFRLIGGGDVKLCFFLLFLLPAETSVFLIWLAMLFAGIAGIVGYIRFRNRFIRLGPAVFLAAAATAGLFL